MKRLLLVLVGVLALALLVVTSALTLSSPREEAGPDDRSPERRAETAPDRAAPELSDEVPGDAATAGETGALVVVVHGPDGPVAGVQIHVRVERWVECGATDDEGIVRVDPIAAGRVDVSARSREFPDPRATRVEVAAGAETVVRFSLEAGVLLTGHVTDAGTGAPVDRATVGVAYSFPKRFVTGSDGGYRLRGVPRGRVRLIAYAPGHPPAEVDVAVPGDVDSFEHDIAIVRGARLSGVVVDGAGAPFAGVAVGVHHPNDRRPEGAADPVETGEDGRFLLPVVPAKRPFHLVARLEGYPDTRTEVIRLESGEERTDIRIVLLPGGGIRGRVLLSDGSPAVGASVTCRTVTGWAKPAAVTDAEGRFALFPLLPGRYQVLVLPGDRLPAVEQIVGAVEPGEWIESVEVRIAPSNRISGRVRDADGNPVAGVVVTADPLPIRVVGGGQATTDEDGGFTIGGLEAGRFRLEVRAWEPVSRTVEVGATDVTFELPVPGTIVGRVVAESTVMPRWLKINLVPRTGTPRQELAPVRSGAFRLKVTPGVWRLLVAGGDAYAEEAPEVKVAAGMEARVTLTLGPGAAIRCRVLDHDRRTAVRASVRLSGKGEAVSPVLGITGPDGVFLATGLRPGIYRIVVTRGSLVVGKDGVEARSGQTTDLPLSLPGWGRLVVRVRDADGAPVGKAAVEVKTEAGLVSLIATREEGETDAEGACTRERVPEGRLTVRVSRAGYGEATKAVLVGRGADLEVVITLPK